VERAADRLVLIAVGLDRMNRTHRICLSTEQQILFVLFFLSRKRAEQLRFQARRLVEFAGKLAA